MIKRLKELLRSIPEGKLDTHSGMVRRIEQRSSFNGPMKVSTSRYPVAECFYLSPEHPVIPEIAEAYAKLFSETINNLDKLLAVVEAAQNYINESPCDPDITDEQIKAWAEYQKAIAALEEE